jgi:hypothetical protein
MRSKVIAGSLLGAIAVHIACGQMPPGTGGPIGSIMSVLSDGGVAHAAEDGGVACSCPVPPAPPVPPETTFSLRIDRGNGPEEPMADWSRAEVALNEFSPQTNGPAKGSIRVTIRFRLNDLSTVGLVCSVNATADGHVYMSGEQPFVGQCQILGYESADRSIATNVPVNGYSLSNAEIMTLTDQRIEIRLPDITLPTYPRAMNGSLQNTPTGMIKMTGIVVHHTNESANYVTPPRAYKP